MDVYAPNIGSQQCALDAFEQGVECSSGDWGCYGSGDGLLYQETAKKCPQFAVECCAIGLRHLRQHWGPINRHEVELNPDVDGLLQQIEEALGALPDQVVPPEVEPPEPEPLPPATDISVVISSGHGQHVRGASGYIDEVNEARRVVEEVARLMRAAGAVVVVFHDNSSTSQNENLNTIVATHNKHGRDLDVSVHFNAFETTSKPMGTEVLYLTQEALARKVSAAIAMAGDFPDRGPKKRTDLAFLNGTNEPSILIETCFVDSGYDTSAYLEKFPAICKAIADTLCAS
jgi:N-acetylmuramoyl-L-alanine amidase